MRPSSEAEWKVIVADIETDGLLPRLTKIHSIAIRDVPTGEVSSFTDSAPRDWYDAKPNRGRLGEGLARIATAKTCYMHNGLAFDCKVIAKLYPFTLVDTTRIKDTLVMARSHFAHIRELDAPLVESGVMPPELSGRHSLKAWGIRLGLHKGDYGESTDWQKWTPEMQEYCEQDTAVTLALLRHMPSDEDTEATFDTEAKLARYLEAQEDNGVPFDMEAARRLHTLLVQRRAKLLADLQHTFPPWMADAGTFTPKRDNRTRGYIKSVEMTKVALTVFNPSSRDHIADRLTAIYGWKPTIFTDGGKPQVDDKILNELPYEGAKQLAEYLLITKRLGQLSEGDAAWMLLATKAGPKGGAITGMYHIHGEVNQSGTVTHRAAHSGPNMAQVPRVATLYGRQSRELFTVPKGWQMLGADASGLELRCLAHYLHRYDGGAYARLVETGDVHSANRDALGLTGWDGRMVAKTFIYAFLYGAGDRRLGALAEPNAPPKNHPRIGRLLRAKFLSGMPAMQKLTRDVGQTARQRGHVKLIDRRHAHVRHQHAALNTLLQGTGAVICKRWLVEMSDDMTRTFGPQGWNGKWAALLWVHDELELAVRPEIAERAMEIVTQAIRRVSDIYSMNVLLAGEARLGATWADVH